MASLFSGDMSNIESQLFVGDSTASMARNVFGVAALTPFFFIGFDVIPQAAEEISVPLKKIGGIMILSILLAVAFYALVIFGVGYVMNPSDIAASQAGTGLVTATPWRKPLAAR